MPYGNTTASPNLVGTIPTTTVQNSQAKAPVPEISQKVAGASTGYQAFPFQSSGSTPTYSPTVVSSQGAIDSIGGMNARTNNYTKPAAVQNNNQNTGTGNPNTQNPSDKTDYSNMSYEDIYKSALGGQNAQPVDPVYQQELDLINSQRQNQDAVTQASIGAIEGQYRSRLVDAQQKQAGENAGIKQALNLGGSSRYAPVSTAGLLSSKERYDMQTLSDLQSTENSEIAKLRQAQSDNDYKSMKDSLAVVDNIRSQKIALAGKIADNMASVNKDTRDKLRSAQADALSTAQSNNAPKSVLEAVGNAKTPAEAYSAISGYGGGANIDVEKVTNVDGSSSIVRVDKNTGKIIGTTNIGGNEYTGGSALSATDYKDFITGLTPEGVSNFNKLSTQDQSNVKQLINGDALLSDLFTSRGAAGATLRQQVLQKAQAVDPTFSENTNKQRYAFQTTWNNPNTGIGKTRNAINTALGHLAELKDLSSKLPQNDLRSMNNVENVLNKEFGDPAVTSFRIALSALASEVASTYKGGVPDKGEVDQWQKALAEGFSKKQFDGAFNTVANLLSSKITASRYQYETAMGKPLSTSIIDPDKRQALIDAGIDPKAIARENVPSEPKTGVAGSIDTARSQGYTDAEILSHLSNDPLYSPNIATAKGIGYTDAEILKYLENQ